MRTNTNNPDGSGNGPESDYLNRIRQRLLELQFYDSQTIAFEQTTRGVRAHVRNPQVLGITGWFFGTKIELPTAPYGSFGAQQVIHIQATHAIVTTGIRDLANPTGPLVTSCAGIWVATQYVPSQTTVSGNPVWNLPQYPMPVPSNFDDPTNFWIYMGDMTC